MPDDPDRWHPLGEAARAFAAPELLEALAAAERVADSDLDCRRYRGVIHPGFRADQHEVRACREARRKRDAVALAHHAIVADLWRRLAAGDLVGRARPGVAEAAKVELPGDTWPALRPSNWGAGIVEATGGRLYYSVEIRCAPAPLAVQFEAVGAAEPVERPMPKTAAPPPVTEDEMRSWLAQRHGEGRMARTREDDLAALRATCGCRLFNQKEFYRLRHEVTGRRQGRPRAKA